MAPGLLMVMAEKSVFTKSGQEVRFASPSLPGADWAKQLVLNHL